MPVNPRKGLAQAATGNAQALGLYQRGVDMLSRGEKPMAHMLMMEAARLDPQFREAAIAQGRLEDQFLPPPAPSQEEIDISGDATEQFMDGDIGGAFSMALSASQKYPQNREFKRMKSRLEDVKKRRSLAEGLYK